MGVYLCDIECLLSEFILLIRLKIYFGHRNKITFASFSEIFVTNLY